MFKPEAAMAGELKGQKIAVLATGGVEQVELTEPGRSRKPAPKSQSFPIRTIKFRASSITTRGRRFPSAK
jgi:hypothetical protein